jgi:hypothetical protein
MNIAIVCGESKHWENQMIDRRRAIHLALAAVMLTGAGLLPSSAARAQQTFQRFFPLLVDLQGWTGNKPDGLSMEIPGNSMVTATREYERGDARLNAQVIIGAAAQGALAATNAGVKIETAEGRMSTSTIDGMQVTRSFTINDKSGAILVGLGTSALFTLSFNGVAEDEALMLARKFDWKAIQAAMPK